jgi:hypothetical protein
MKFCILVIQFFIAHFFFKLADFRDYSFLMNIIWKTFFHWNCISYFALDGQKFN